MLIATGINVIKNADGSITIRADVIDDQTGKKVFTHDYQGKDINAIKADILADMKSWKKIITDKDLIDQVVGQVLGSV